MHSLYSTASENQCILLASGGSRHMTLSTVFLIDPHEVHDPLAILAFLKYIIYKTGTSFSFFRKAVLP